MATLHDNKRRLTLLSGSYISGRIESDHQRSLLTEWTEKKSTIQVQTDEHLRHK